MQHQKFGTVLYRYQGDLFHALNAALAVKEHREVSSGGLEQAQYEIDFAQQMNQVCTILNDKNTHLHSEAD